MFVILFMAIITSAGTRAVTILYHRSTAQKMFTLWMPKGHHVHCRIRLGFIFIFRTRLLLLVARACSSQSIITGQHSSGNLGNLENVGRTAGSFVSLLLDRLTMSHRQTAQFPDCCGIKGRIQLQLASRQDGHHG